MGEGRGVLGAVWVERGWAAFGDLRWRSFPVAFLGTQFLPGQLESSLSLGLCLRAKCAKCAKCGAKKMAFILSDGVSW